MKSLWVLFLLLSFVTGLATTIPFNSSRGLVEVTVVLDDQTKGVFALDTGADHLYIDRNFAIENNLNFAMPTPGKSITGVNGASKALPISLKSLALGSERLENIKATAIDIEKLTNDKRVDNPDGLIGYDILRQFYVTVDCFTGTMELEKDEPRFLSGRKYRTIPFKMYNHLIIVDITLNEQVTVPMLLDFGASVTSVSQSLADRLNLCPDNRRLAKVSEVRIDDRVSTDNVYVVVTDFSRYRKSTPRASYEGILGVNFLSRYKITIDYHTEHIYIHLL